MHRFKHVTHPHNVLLVVRRLGPAPDDFEEEGRGPASTGVSSSPTRAIAPPSAQTESETREGLVQPSQIASMTSSVSRSR